MICRAQSEKTAFLPTIAKSCRGVPLSEPAGMFNSCLPRRFKPVLVRAESEGTMREEVSEIGMKTSEEIIQFGKDVGVDLSFNTAGPGFRAVARASHDDSQIIGYCEGFLRPGGQIIHLDKMEVFKKAVDKAREENPEGFKNGGNILGVGLLLGYLCLLHAKSNGLSKAEFLAIDDEEFQHKRLVRYYQIMGFKVFRYVGEDVRNIPDRLIWGGCGTLMGEDVMVLLAKWTKKLFGSK